MPDSYINPPDCGNEVLDEVGSLKSSAPTRRDRSRKCRLRASPSVLKRPQRSLAAEALNLGDETGKPLDGASNYTIRFDNGATPPADAFWSITLYDPQGFQVANPINRFAVSNWMPFKTNPDGSLDL